MVIAGTESNAGHLNDASICTVSFPVPQAQWGVLHPHIQSPTFDKLTSRRKNCPYDDYPGISPGLFGLFLNMTLHPSRMPPFSSTTSNSPTSCLDSVEGTLLHRCQVEANCQGFCFQPRLKY